MSLYFYIHCTRYVIFCISARARGREHQCAISFIQQCITTWCFWTNRVSQWFNGPTVWFECFSKSFIKIGTCCHLLVVLLSFIYPWWTSTRQGASTKPHLSPHHPPWHWFYNNTPVYNTAANCICFIKKKKAKTEHNWNNQTSLKTT